MSTRYQSGEAIHQGDRVSYDGDTGVIEVVMEGLTGDPEGRWPVVPRE